MVVDAAVNEFLQDLEPLHMNVVNVVQTVDTAVDQPCPEKSPQSLVGPLERFPSERKERNSNSSDELVYKLKGTSERKDNDERNIIKEKKKS